MVGVVAKAKRPLPHTEWLWDIGAAVDVVPRSALKGSEKFIQTANTGLFIHTAGGVHEANQEVVLTTNALEEKAIRPIVMDSSPALLSAGWRCMELGYEFHWRPYSTPVLTTPSGRRVNLRVDNYVPVLDAEMYTITDANTASSIFLAPAVPPPTGAGQVSAGGESETIEVDAGDAGVGASLGHADASEMLA